MRRIGNRPAARPYLDIRGDDVGYCADPSVGPIGCVPVTPRCESGAVLSSVPPLLPSRIPRCVSSDFVCDAANAMSDAAPSSATIATPLNQ